MSIGAAAAGSAMPSPRGAVTEPCCPALRDDERVVREAALELARPTHPGGAVVIDDALVRFHLEAVRLAGRRLQFWGRVDAVLMLGFVAVATWRVAGSVVEAVLVAVGLLVGCAVFASFPSARAEVRPVRDHGDALNVWVFLAAAAASWLVLRELHLVDVDPVRDLTSPAGPPLWALVPALLAFTAGRVAVMSVLYRFGNRSLRSDLATVSGAIVVLFAQVEVLLRGTGSVPRGRIEPVGRRLIRARRLIAENLWPHLPLASSDPQAARRQCQAVARVVDRSLAHLLRCGPGSRSAVQETTGRVISALSQSLYDTLPVADEPERTDGKGGAGRVVLGVLNAVVPLVFVGLVHFFELDLPGETGAWFTLFAICWSTAALLSLTGRDNGRIMRSVRDFVSMVTAGSSKE